MIRWLTSMVERLVRRAPVDEAWPRKSSAYPIFAFRTELDHFADAIGQVGYTGAKSRFNWDKKCAQIFMPNGRVLADIVLERKRTTGVAVAEVTAYGLSVHAESMLRDILTRARVPVKVTHIFQCRVAANTDTLPQ